MPDTMRRRSFLRLALAGVGGAAVGVPLSACGAESAPDARPDPTRGPQPAQAEGGGRILLAYFSRPGENYWNGGRRYLKVGNTEVLARAISARLDCDVHRIDAVDPYPADYDETVQRNVREQTPTPARRSPVRSRRSTDTTRSCSPARSGTSERR
jgi:hypothetical protein